MIEKTSPIAAASAVRMMAVTTTVRCRRNVAAEFALHESDHLASYCVELAIEIVAQLIDPLERFDDRLLVAAVKQRQQTRDFLVELDAGAVGQIGEAGIDANERRRITEAGAFGDQAIEQAARGLRFSIDRAAAFFETLARVGVAGLVRRRLDFLDHHAAQRHRAFKRVHIGPRQGRIGRDVALGQLFQAARHLHHQRQRDERRDRHQGDQDQRDPDDFALDRQAADHRAITLRL